MKSENINLRLIIEGCRDGNRQSQRKLYQHFYGYGLSLAFRYASNRLEAEEVFNDGFLKAFQHLDKYDSAYPFKPWLRKIIIHSAIDYFRKHKKHQVLIPFENETELTTPVIIDQEEDVLPIVQQLSPAYRLVFNLYVMEEYKHHEIAEMLGISVGTSKSNLARAKVKLKSLWLQQKGAVKKNKNG